MTDEITPERLAKIKSIVAEKPTTCTKHGLRANRLVEHVPALIAQVERLTKRVEWLRGTVEDRDHQITYLETDREQETHFKIEAQQRAEAAEARATAAEADRDALLKAIGFTPGPLVPEVRRDFILQDAAGMRPAMVQARREARIVEGDALMWQYFCAEKGADRESGLLLKVWEQRRAAEARATAAEAKLADLASAVMEEAEPALGERMRCVRLARAVKETTP